MQWNNITYSMCVSASKRVCVWSTDYKYILLVLSTLHYTLYICKFYSVLRAVYACIVSKRQVKFTQASTESFLVLAVQISMGRIALQL